MLKSERQKYILRQVNQNNLLFSADLRNGIQVSDDVIHKNLRQLSNDHKIIKVHENALSLCFNVCYYSLKKDLQAYTKSIVAHKAVSNIRNGLFVLTRKAAAIIVNSPM